MFAPSFSGFRGQALLSLLFAAPMIHTTDSVATKDDETVTVTADANTATEATGGYRPLSTSTATLTDVPMLDIPQVINTVNGQVLENQNTTTLDEAFYNVSSMVQTNTLGGTQDAFIRRELGANRDGSIMTNGLRTVLPRSFSAAIERVEVLKGPVSTLYGTLDPGGLVNVAAKRPEKTFHSLVSATSSGLGGGTGQLNIAGPIEGTQLAHRFTEEVQDEDYWRNFGKERSTFTAPSLTWSDNSATITVLYPHRNYKTPFDHGTIFDLTMKQPINVDRKIRFDESFDIIDGQSDLAQLNAGYHPNSQWTACFDYSYSQDKYSDNQARVTAYDATAGTLTRCVDATQGSIQRIHATRADLQRNVDIARFYNEILGGVSYEYYGLLRTDIIRCKKAKDFNIYNPVYGNASKCTTVSASDSDQTIKQENYSAYTQDALYLIDSQIAIAGIRYQHYTQYTDKGRPFNVNTGSRGEQRTPRPGLAYKLAPSVSLFASYSQTFVPQSSVASYIGDLPPESSNAYEIGAKFELFDGAATGIALFDIHRRNMLYIESISDEAIAKTAGRVRSRGVEVDLAGTLAENTNITTSCGYTDVKILEDPDYTGKPLPNAPRHTGLLFLTHDIHSMPSNNTLTFSDDGRGVSRRSATNGADYYLPGYFAAGTFAAYKMRLQYPVTLQLNVKNLFDKTYYTSFIATNDLGNQISDPREA